MRFVRESVAGPHYGDALEKKGEWRDKEERGCRVKGTLEERCERKVEKEGGKRVQGESTSEERCEKKKEGGSAW